MICGRAARAPRRIAEITFCYHLVFSLFIKGEFVQNCDKNTASAPMAEAVFQVFQDKSGNSGRFCKQQARTRFRSLSKVEMSSCRSARGPRAEFALSVSLREPAPIHQGSREEVSFLSLSIVARENKSRLLSLVEAKTCCFLKTP